MPQPSRYRKKPIEVEAMRLEPGTDNYKDVCDWIYSSHRGEVAVSWRSDGSVLVPTLEGDMEARPGDWIVRGVEGEFYPVKPSIFDATYENQEN